jgi:hypothetical protein
MTESEDSVRAQVERLEPGESVAKAKIVGFGEFADDVRREATRMRKTLDGAVHRAKRSCPDRRFTVETGHFWTRAESIAIVAVVTRVA